MDLPLRAPSRSRPSRGDPIGSQRATAALALAACLLFLAPAAGQAGSPPRERRAEPVAGAFVYPVGDELDFTKAHSGEPIGFYVSDSYLVLRNGKHGQRVHKGVDLANGQGGAPVRAVASGVVVLADTQALIRVRKAQRVKVSRKVKGKRVVKWTTRTRTTTKWRTGWGHYIVVRHTLPDGQTVHSLYGHLKPRSILVHAGDVVAAGEVIAQVGRSGRASSPHLHLEIRKAVAEASAGDEFDPEDAEDATVEDRTFALLATVDPVSFLERHVRRYDDLDPRSWEARYALAACRDGIVCGDHDRFEPDASITRADFYAALAATFDLPVGSERSFAALSSALGKAGILGTTPKERERAGDHMTRSEALEILLRCLDRSAAKGRSLAAFQRETLCSDFNRIFAGSDAAERAQREARTAALEETAARRKAADAEYARAVRAQKAQGTVRKRVKRPVVKPVTPAPRLDPGFEALARSDHDLTRAEACLLFASSYRLGQERLSALEQAASRVATASVSSE